MDESVNFVISPQQGTTFEARYVRREEEYFCAYLSSHAGCNKGCKFCHLTASGQTNYRQANWYDFDQQCTLILRHYLTQPKAERVHINFMSRGEPLDNHYLDGHMLNQLSYMCRKEGLKPRFNVSTIFPKTCTADLAIKFAPISPLIYWSLWSINEEWRKEWMPGAMDYREAADKLVYYQRATGAGVVIHGAFIKDQNDSGDMIEYLAALRSRLQFRFNIVRYNPYDGTYGEEAELKNLQFLMSEYGLDWQKVSRVGTDVQASCGMFV